MQTAPDTPSRFRGTLNRPPFEWLDLGTGAVQKELNLLLYTVYFKAIERDDLVSVVHCDNVF